MLACEVSSLEMWLPTVIHLKGLQTLSLARCTLLCFQQDRAVILVSSACPECFHLHCAAELEGYMSATLSPYILVQLGM